MPRVLKLVRIFIAFVFVVAFVFPAGGERLPLKVFTSADGLGSSFVDYLMRDSRGFLWFATRDGLSRFDGSRFITYHIGEKNSPPGIEYIYETRNGDYWITTTGGTYCYRSRSATVPRSTISNGRPVLPAEFVTTGRGIVVEGNDGQLWYAGNELSRITEEAGKVIFTKVPLNLPDTLARFRATDFKVGLDDSLWLNTTVGLLRRLPDGRVIHYEMESSPLSPSQSLIDSGMLVDQQGRIWYARALSLDVFQPEPIEALGGLGPVITRKIPLTPSVPARTNQPIRLPSRPGETLHFTAGDFLAQHQTKRFFQSADGHVWITTERELLEFDGQSFHRQTIEQGLLPSMLRMTEDLAGNIWVGGQTGLLRLDRRSISSFTEADGLASNNVQTMVEASDGTLYFANGDFFLSQFDGTRFRTTRPQIPATATARWTSRYALLDSRDNWWILTRDRLYRFNRSNLSQPAATYTTHDGLKADEMFQIFEDRSGAIWVSQQPLDQAENRGLSRLTPGETKFYTFTEADGFPPDRSPSSFAEDKQGNLWVSFYEGGLARYAEGRFTYFDRKAGVPEGTVTDLLVDRQGRLWLSSGLDGIARIDDTTAAIPGFVHLHIDDGLSSNNVRTLTEDKQGNIYAGTVRGVDRILPDGKSIKHYSVSDGLAGDFVVDSHCDRNGVVWFATTSGLSKLIPTVEVPSPAPAVWIGGVRVAGVAQPVPALGQRELALPTLRYNQNTLEIDFFGLDFRPGQILRYQYLLEGTGGDWSAPTEQRTITLANLQPGSYRFLVRAVDANGAITVQPAVVVLRIDPPFWRRWWFIALCVAVVLAAAIALYRYRIARYREVNQALQAANQAAENLRRAEEERWAELERVRSRIATDLHDDIGSSLTQIAIMSEVAQQQQAASGAVDDPWDVIYHVSNELVGKMSDIVWAINPSKDHLPDLTQRMRRFASDVLSAKGIDLEFVAPPFDENLALGANVRREVFLIFKEAINNIVKHSNATVVEIEFALSGTNLRLRVADNGHGFTTQTSEAAGTLSAQPSGTGLGSMRSRAEELGGVYTMVTEPGEGTIMTLVLPVRTLKDPESITIQLDRDSQKGMP